MKGSSQINLGIVGCGYWGPNLIRNFQAQPDARVVQVADKDEARLAQTLRHFPTVEATTDACAMIARPDIDAVVIATPVSTHFELAMLALNAGKHVFVEKPMADSSDACRRLVDAAAARGLTLMTDHVFIYTSALQAIDKMIQTKELGELFYYDSTRINLGLFQSDVNVLWDLAVHDLGVLDMIAPSRPMAVSAMAHRHFPGQPENMATLCIRYESNFVAQINVNWLSPVKVRKILIGGSRRMIVYDDIEPSHKVMVYEKGVDVILPRRATRQLQMSYRSGDMYAPRLEARDALDRAAAHFVDCIQTGQPPRSDGTAGLRVVTILEAAEKSLARNGVFVDIHGFDQ